MGNGTDNNILTNSRGIDNKGTSSAMQMCERPGKIKEIDEMRATIQSAFNVSIPHMDNDHMVKEAKRLNSLLFVPDQEVGPKQKSAIAESLIKMHHNMGERIQNAPKDKNHLPSLKGISWKDNDPLAAIVEGISPFHMIEWWNSYIKKEEVKLSSKEKRKPSTKVEEIKPNELPRLRHTPPPKELDSIFDKITKKDIGLPPKPKVESPHDLIPTDIRKITNLGTWATTMAGALAKHWLEARDEGIQKAVRDVSIKYFAAAIASMAMKVNGKKFLNEIPEPDLKAPRGMEEVEAIVTYGIQTHDDIEVHKKAKELGFKTAQKIIRELYVINSYQPYLLYLQNEYKTPYDVYNAILWKLRSSGIVPRYDEVTERYKKRYPKR